MWVILIVVGMGVFLVLTMAPTAPPMDRAPGRPGPEESPENEELQWARAKLWMWDGLTLYFLLMYYTQFTTEGLHVTAPVSSFKLAKIPILGLPFRFRAFEKADLAFVVALLLFLCVTCVWKYLLRSYLAPESERSFDAEAFKEKMEAPAIILLILDAVMMYVGLSALSWGDVTFSFSSALVTVTMALVLVAVSLVSLKLERDVQRLKGE